MHPQGPSHPGSDLGLIDSRKPPRRVSRCRTVQRHAHARHELVSVQKYLLQLLYRETTWRTHLPSLPSETFRTSLRGSSSSPEARPLTEAALFNGTDRVPGTAGLGAESVFQIAQHRPAAIYFTGRSEASAQAVTARVEAVAPGANLVFIACDLASLASVQAAADHVLAATDRLDVLMCNAGVMATPLGLTHDGYERQFGVNHLGHALLVQRLLPVLRATAARPGADVRVVTLTSTGFRGHPRGGIHFDTLRSTQDFGMGGPWVRYGQSKLANLLYARELARRTPELTSLAVHPGVVSTGLVQDLSPVHRFIVRATNPRGYLTPAQGAHNQLWAAFAPRAQMESGQVYGPVGQPLPLQDGPTTDDEVARKLWEWTDEALKDYL
jgi:NAD(P)-dependent dehydrogenase (short-subunit alcohol dehydrogenase family)